MPPSIGSSKRRLLHSMMVQLLKAPRRRGLTMAQLLKAAAMRPPPRRGVLHGAGSSKTWASPRRNLTAARPDDGCVSSRHHDRAADDDATSQAPRRHDSSSSVGSSRYPTMVVSLQGTTTARPMTMQLLKHHGGTTPRAAWALPGSASAGSSKALTAWAQAPPRQWWRYSTTAGLNLGRSISRLRSIFFLKINFWCRLT
jgi:hypothetical protein